MGTEKLLLIAKDVFIFFTLPKRMDLGKIGTENCSVEIQCKANSIFGQYLSWNLVIVM